MLQTNNTSKTFTCLPCKCTLLKQHYSTEFTKNVIPYNKKATIRQIICMNCINWIICIIRLFVLIASLIVKLLQTLINDFYSVIHIEAISLFDKL